MKYVLDPAVAAKMNKQYEQHLGPVPDPNDAAAWTDYLDRLKSHGAGKSAIELDGARTSDAEVKDHIKNSADSTAAKQKRSEKLLSVYTKPGKNGKRDLNKNALMIGGMCVGIPLIGFLLFAGSAKPAPSIQQASDVTPANTTTPVVADENGDIPAAPISTTPVNSDGAPAPTGTATPASATPTVSAVAPELEDGLNNPSNFSQPTTPIQRPDTAQSSYTPPSSGYSQASTAPTLEVPVPTTERDPSVDNVPFSYPSATSTVPAPAPAAASVTPSPVTLTRPATASTRPSSSTTAPLESGVPLDFGTGSLPTPGSVSLPVASAPQGVSAPAAVVATPVPVRSSQVYVRSAPSTSGTDAAGGSAANRTLTAYRVTPPPIVAPRVYVAPVATRPAATVYGTPRTVTRPQPASRAATIQPPARAAVQVQAPAAAPAPSSAPMSVSLPVASAASRAVQTAQDAVTGVVGDVSDTASAQSQPQVPAAAPARPAASSMVVYRRAEPANTQATPAAAAPSAATVIYSRTAVQTQQVAAAQSNQTPPANPPVPATPVRTFTPGATIPAVLTGDVTTALGGAVPVIVRAADGWLWIGAATIDGTRRMQIAFDRTVDPVSGLVTPVRAMAFGPNGKAGLDVTITNKAPNFALDLLRAAVSGFDRYVTGVANQRTVTTLANGTSTTTSSAPGLGDTILANTSSIFKLPETGSTFIPVGEAEQGSRLFVVVSVQSDPAAGTGTGSTLTGALSGGQP